MNHFTGGTISSRRTSSPITPTAGEARLAVGRLASPEDLFVGSHQENMPSPLGGPNLRAGGQEAISEVVSVLRTPLPNQPPARPTIAWPVVSQNSASIDLEQAIEARPVASTVARPTHVLEPATQQSELGEVSVFILEPIGAQEPASQPAGFYDCVAAAVTTGVVGGFVGGLVGISAYGSLATFGLKVCAWSLAAGAAGGMVVYCVKGLCHVVRGALPEP